jgi:hypothetical protein
MPPDDQNRKGDRSRRPNHELDRIRFNFLNDRRLRFLVHTIALAVGVFLLVMFDLPLLFGLGFVAWWIVWSLQRDSADIYREVYDINERLAHPAQEDGSGKGRS